MRFDWGEMMCNSRQNIRSQANCSQESETRMLALSTPLVSPALFVFFFLFFFFYYYPPVPSLYRYTISVSPSLSFPSHSMPLLWAVWFAQHGSSFKLICTANQIWVIVCQIFGFIPATIALWCAAVEFLIMIGRQSDFLPAAALMYLAMRFLLPQSLASFLSINNSHIPSVHLFSLSEVDCS